MISSRLLEFVNSKAVCYAMSDSGVLRSLCYRSAALSDHAEKALPGPFISLFDNVPVEKMCSGQWGGFCNV